MQPSEFWNLSPYEFWLEFDTRAEIARRNRTEKVNGKNVRASDLQTAQATARRLHKAKQEAKQ